jgi:predicted TIM-barrel fold metal-dependent hydrolase
VTHSAPTFTVPAGATDCHVHVFGPDSRYPFSACRVYTPGDASVESLEAHQRVLGLSRAVVVQPSPYGTDNACSVDAIARLGERARGVAVIDPDRIAVLAACTRRHARRRQSRCRGDRPRHRVKIVVRLAAVPLGWHVQTYTNISVIDALRNELPHLPATLVFDHFGGARAALGPGQPGFDTLCRLVGEGKAYVKLSGAYRISSATDCTDVARLARALIAANPERMLWGSDWPHPGGALRTGSRRDEIEPFHAIDDGAALNRLAGWTGGSEKLLQSILVDNPARLYGY